MAAEFAGERPLLYFDASNLPQLERENEMTMMTSATNTKAPVAPKAKAPAKAKAPVKAKAPTQPKAAPKATPAPAVVRSVGNNLLSAKAVLADLTIGSWSVRKFDREVSEDIDQREGTQGAGRFNKKLMKSELRTAISHISQAARATHKRLTKPWLDEGCRILPTALFEQHAAAMKDLRLKHEAARETFFKAYPDLVKKAKDDLKKMFKEEEYPPVEIVRQKFHFEVRLLPIPQAADFRVDMAGPQLDRMKVDLESHMKGILTDAMKDTQSQIMDVVGTMAKKLKGYNPDATDAGDKGIFHSSLVDNIRDLVELLPAFNLTDDPKLAKIILRMKQELCIEEAKELRENEVVRKDVLKSAEEILANVSAFMA